MAQMLKQLLDTLPAIAGEPLAILAYIMVVGAWFFWLAKRLQTKTFLTALQAVRDEERPEFAKRSGYAYDELANLSQERRYRLITGRYVLIGIGATFLAVLILVALVLNHRSQAAAMTERLKQRDAEIARIETERRALQVLLDTETRRRNQLAVGVAAMAGQMVATQDPAIAERAGRLQAMVDSLVVGQSLSEWAPEQVATVRLAQATAANARGEFDEALKLLNPLVEGALGALYSSALQAKGEAHYGKRDWKGAAQTFQLIATLKPDDLKAQLLAANCLVHLGQGREADAAYSKVVESPNAVPEQLLWRVAARNNRGNLRSADGRFDQAIEDFSEGVRQLRALPQTSDRALGLGLLLTNRGFALTRTGQLADGRRDYDEATRLLEALSGTDPRVPPLLAWLTDATRLAQTPTFATERSMGHSPTTSAPPARNGQHGGPPDKCFMCHAGEPKPPTPAQTLNVLPGNAAAGQPPKPPN
jgi:tetratricopeptide (TPR) repeat protein